MIKKNEAKKAHERMIDDINCDQDLKGMLGRSNASHDDEPILSERDHPDACPVCEKIKCECPEEEQDAQ